MLICKQLVTGITVQGSMNKRTGRHSEYLLTGYPVPKCTCVSWAINRNRAVSIRPDVTAKHPDVIAWCRHLDDDYERLCHFTEARDGASIIPGICPFCGGPTIEVTAPGECQDCHTQLTDDNLTIGLCDNCLVARV